MTKQKTDIREVLNEQVPEERDELLGLWLVLR